VVGRLAGGIDMRKEVDGRISAAEVHHKLGLLPFACVVIMDITLAALAVAIAQFITDSTAVVIASGIAAVCGHNWSLFLKFKGGLGATAILGAMLPVIFWPALYGLILAAIIVAFTHRSSLSTTIGIFTMSGVAFVEHGTGLLAFYPLTLFCLMLLKKYQVAKTTNPAH
jgi:glycerol-3-phosphate acyltransferase PlsY